MNLHIHSPAGYFAGYVRAVGGKKWRKVTGRCSCAERALSLAVARMRKDDARAVACWCDLTGWYAPVSMMEANRK